MFTVSNLILFEQKAFTYKFLPAPKVRKTFALPIKDEEVDTIIGDNTSSRADTVDPDTNTHHKDTSKSKATTSKSKAAASKPKATASKSKKVLSHSQTDDEFDQPDFKLDFSGSEGQDEGDEEDGEDKDGEDKDEDKDKDEDEDEDEDKDMDKDKDEDEDKDDDEDDARPLAKKKLAPNPTSKPKVVDQYKDWDNGEALTPAQRANVMALGLNYKRAQMMNKLRNAHVLREMNIDGEVSDLLKDLKSGAKQANKPKHQLKGKEKVTEARKTTR
jgi:Ni/Co efflux regulator RcnB